MSDRSVFVFRDWLTLERLAQPKLIGTLRSRIARNAEVFDFEFADEALTDTSLRSISLDPQIGVFPGPQFPKAGARFGVFADSSPDRWGRTLITRRFDREKHAGNVPTNARLGELDFLLGVHDAFRVGALRFKETMDGPFLDDRDDSAAPPFVRLRQLEAACRAIEGDRENENPDGNDWIRMLLAPGASLGGARPKASVVDTNDNLWIAKFPSVSDDRDIGAWEFVAARLAERSGLHVPQSEARALTKAGHTFLVRRFDRSHGARVHFASAMTLTGRSDGDDVAVGASYLEIADVLITQGAHTDRDLRELWSRIVFNILVSNTDDHLRNHGFLLERGGWSLSPAYDVNPVPHGFGLALNVDENDNALDLDLARSVAAYFRVKPTDMKTIVERTKRAVATWPEVAEDIGLGARARARMQSAFGLAKP